MPHALESGPAGSPAPEPIFERVTRIVGILVLDSLSLVVLAVLIRALILLAVQTYAAYAAFEVGMLKEIGVGVLTVFVFVEIFGVFRDYRRTAHLPVLDILNLSITIVVREIWIQLFEGDAAWQKLVAIAVILLVLGGLWVAVRQVESRHPADTRRPPVH